MNIISVEEEFKKNPQLKQQDIDDLREWTVQEKCAPETITDLQLVIFLHSNDYSMEETKKTIKCNYLWRAEQPDYFTKRNLNLDPLLGVTSEFLAYMLLPKQTSKDELVFVSIFLNNDAKNFHCLHLMKIFFMFMDVYLLHHGTSKGVIFIHDCEAITFAMARRMQISSIKALFFYLQEAIPFKLNACHFMNVHPAFDFIFTLMKPFIKGSLLKKMHLHKPGSSTIFAHLPPASVPKRFNGEEDSSIFHLQEQSKKLLESYEPWFEKEELELTKFAQSVGIKPKEEEEDSFEASNSFKKLDLD